NPTPGSSGTATTYDYEAGNGRERFYRARAVTDHGDGLTVSSDWCAPESATWASADWWLKHPQLPDLNQAVRVYSLPGYTRPDRSGRFQGLGSSTAIVVSDYPGPPQGEIVLDLDSLNERADLEAI